MPDFAPNPDAPATVWAGEYDAQALADATGASWAAPLFALHQPRVVNIAELCSSPPPSAPVFTTTDLVMGMNIFADQTAIQLKLKNFVDNGLHRTYCTAVDVPPLPPIPNNPPPADLPAGPPPEPKTGKELREIWQWVNWIKDEILPRSYYSGGSFAAEGQGSAAIASDTINSVLVYAAGIRVSITARPIWAGRSNGGTFPVFYDLGWISVGTSSGADQPMRLAHDSMVIYGHLGQVTKVWWNLLPDVTITIRPLYPMPYIPTE